jgi:hypothetical protein
VPRIGTALALAVIALLGTPVALAAPAIGADCDEHTIEMRVYVRPTTAQSGAPLLDWHAWVRRSAETMPGGNRIGPRRLIVFRASAPDAPGVVLRYCETQLGDPACRITGPFLGALR